jgi:hypothetical protein
MDYQQKIYGWHRVLSAGACAIWPVTSMPACTCSRANWRTMSSLAATSPVTLSRNNRRRICRSPIKCMFPMQVVHTTAAMLAFCQVVVDAV